MVDTINQFIPTKVSNQTNCVWMDNEDKNLASLKNNLYQNFRDKSEASKLKYNRKRNQLQKLVEKKKRNFYQQNLIPTQQKC